MPTNRAILKELHVATNSNYALKLIKQIDSYPNLQNLRITFFEDFLKKEVILLSKPLTQIKFLHLDFSNTFTKFTINMAEFIISILTNVEDLELQIKHKKKLTIFDFF